LNLRDSAPVAATGPRHGREDTHAGESMLYRLKHVALFICAVIALFALAYLHPIGLVPDTVSLSANGALHALTIIGALRGTHSRTKQLIFVVGACAISVLSLQLAELAGDTLSWGSVIPYVAAVAAIGALGYSLLIRVFLFPYLSIAWILTASAICIGLTLDVFRISFGSAYLFELLTITWWATMSLMLLLSPSRR
jgi:hypothetical protein